MMNAKFYSDPFSGSDKGNNNMFVPRYGMGFSYAPESIDTILGKKCLAFLAPCSSGRVSVPNAGAAEVICSDFKRNEKLHNELKKITVTPTGTGYIAYCDTRLLYSELTDRLDKLKKIGLLRTVVFGTDCVYVAVEQAANSFITKDFAVIYVVNELKRKGAFDIRYNCKLRDTHGGEDLQTDVIYQQEKGGHAEFLKIVLNPRLTEYTNPNTEKSYRKIIAAAERLRGLTLIVSPSVNTALLGQILANYTRCPIRIVKLDELYRLR